MEALEIKDVEEFKLTNTNNNIVTLASSNTNSKITTT
jgi:hypothetical protein